jgi:hypothetical protein
MTSEATHTPARFAPVRIPLKGGGPFMDAILDLIELLGKAGW